MAHSAAKCILEITVEMASDSCCSFATAWDQIQRTAVELKISLHLGSLEFSAPVYGWRSGPLLVADLRFPDIYMGFIAIQMVCQPRLEQFQ